MKAAVIGGKLQGVEACYLAKKAGWDTILIDHDQYIPARDLADRFYPMDITDKEAETVLKKCDLIIPALENQAALGCLRMLADKIKVPFVFDPEAYQVSCSKVASNRMFLETGIPIPGLWPQGRFPLVVKPSGLSGSAGVKRVDNEKELNQLGITDEVRTDWVIQEFVQGPSYSIEVIGFQGNYQVFQVTELEMDQAYDCKRVLTPAGLRPDLVKELTVIGEKAAAALKLCGIMDVEVILHQGSLKVLEIDARLPSQTPTAVYHSTGINLLEILGMHFGYNKSVPVAVSGERGVIYEHLRVTPAKAEILGEHIMADVGPLKLCTDFFGADEALTNFQPGCDTWVATLINTGQTRADAWEKRNHVLKSIMKSIGKPGWEDLSPVI